MENIKEIFKIGIDDDIFKPLNNLKINEIYDVRDKSNKRLIFNEILLNNNKFFIESNFNKVISIDPDTKKIIIQIDDIFRNFFEELDNTILNLLQELFINDEFLTLLGSYDDNIEYNSLIKEDGNNFRFKIDNDTTILYNNNNINFDQIKINDSIRILLSIESINLYPNEKISFLRLYIHLIDVYRPKVYNLNKKSITNYKFSHDASTVFEKIKLDTEDLSYIQTDVKSDNCNYENINELQNNNQETNINNTVINTIINTPEIKKRGRQKKNINISS